MQSSTETWTLVNPPLARPAVISPLVDTLCCGGASLLFVVGVFVYAAGMPAEWAQQVFLQDVIWANILINWPHFLSSYRVLYRSREEIRGHTWVALILPALLGTLFVVAMVTAGQNPPERAGLANQAVLDTLFPVAVLLLAWHYTGQSWGMTSSFLFIHGIRMTAGERRLIRCGYHALLLFHVLWVMADERILNAVDYVLPGAALAFVWLYSFCLLLIPVTFLAGLTGFLRMGRRLKRVPPVRAWLPWLATYSWYVLIYYYPGLFFVLQISHALQYIIFTVRVEMNQHADAVPGNQASQNRHGIWYYLILVAVGALVFDGMKYATAPMDPHGLLAALFATTISLHHYFIDGVIWKIRDPAVKQRLFGHLSVS